MKKNKKVTIMDVTIRDGSYLIDFSYTPKQIEEIVRLLSDAGVEYIEASHGIGVGAKKLGYPHGSDDITYAWAAAKGKGKSKVGAIGHPRCTSLDDISALSEYLDFFRMIANADDPKPVKEHVKRCKKEKLETIVQLARTSAVPPKVVAQSVETLESWGVDVVYLVDTTGCMLPGEPTKYVEEIRKRTSQKLGFHAHNTLQLAMANTLEAIEAGCERVDASLLGVGRDAGNVALEALVVAMGGLNIPCGLPLKKIIEAGEYIRPIFSAQLRPSWHTTYIASYRRDLYPLQLIDIIAKECDKTPFEVIDTFAAMPGIVEYEMRDLETLIKLLGGEPEKIFKKYEIKKV